MGCGAGKVTPAESLQSHKNGEADVPVRKIEGTEEVDAPVPPAQPPRLYRRPQLNPSRIPTIDPFPTDRVEDSAAVNSINKGIPHMSISTINNSSPSSLLPPSPHDVSMFHPAAPFIASSLKKHREASSSQIDFFKMLDKKIEEGPDYEEKD